MRWDEDVPLEVRGQITETLQWIKQATGLEMPALNNLVAAKMQNLYLRGMLAGIDKVSKLVTEKVNAAAERIERESTPDHKD